MPSQRCRVLLILVDAATKITADSESPPTVCCECLYKLLPYLAAFPSYKPFSAFRGEWCSVSLNPVAMATKMTTDSESPTPISYKWSLVTFFSI